MSPETKNLLLSAWRENRLAAVHIDLQEGYLWNERGGMDIPLLNLCRSVKNVAAILRPAGIPNIWAMAKDVRWKDQLTTVRLFDREIYSRFGTLVSHVAAQNDEVVVAKTSNSAFDQPDTPLHGYLKEQNKDTLLIGGVNAQACVSATIKDAILSDLYNVIVLPDCINVPETMRTEEYIDFLREECGNDTLFSRRFHSASSLEVIDTLNALSPS